MNKSLALKNKLYLFLSLMFSFLLFLYLIYFLINGERGIISYYKLKNFQKNQLNELVELKKKNNFFIDRVERLQPNTIDLDFLDELLRQNSGLSRDNELVVYIE